MSMISDMTPEMSMISRLLKQITLVYPYGGLKLIFQILRDHPNVCAHLMIALDNYMNKTNTNNVWSITVNIEYMKLSEILIKIHILHKPSYAIVPMQTVTNSSPNKPLFENLHIALADRISVYWMNDRLIIHSSNKQIHIRSAIHSSNEHIHIGIE